MEYELINPFDVQYYATLKGMEAIRDILRRQGTIKKEFVSPKPVINSGYSMILLADLIDKKKRNVGNIRVHVLVGNNSSDVKFIIEWTRTIFGFWYKNEFVLRNVVYDIDNSDFNKLKNVLDPIRWTANGTTKVESMNRMFRKVKKSRVRDSVYRVGLTAG